MWDVRLKFKVDFYVKFWSWSLKFKLKFSIDFCIWSLSFVKLMFLVVSFLIPPAKDSWPCLWWFRQIFLELNSDRPILLTDTDIYRYQYRYIGIGILISVSVYRYRLRKTITFHIGIGIGYYKIQISVSVKSIKPFVEKTFFCYKSKYKF